MDRKSMMTSPDTSADPAGERTSYQYDIAGRLTQITLPIGVQSPDANNTHNVFYAYDQLDRTVSQTQTRVQNGSLQQLDSVACYNAAGDMTSVKQPLAGLTAATINCASSTLAYTTYYQHDLDHRVTVTTDPEGRSQSVTYDQDGNAVTVRDANTNPTNYKFDQLNRQVEVDEPFIATTPGSPTRYISTMTVYDSVGNKSALITPRAFDAAGGHAPFTNFVTSYQYDQDNRLVRTDLPVDTTSTNSNFNTHYYIHQQDDANGVLKSERAAGGAPAGTEVDVPATPDDLGHLAAVQSQSAAATTQTTYTYDLNGNVTDSVQDTQTAPVAKAGRNFHYDYDKANWLKDQCVLATPPTPASCANPTIASNHRIVTHFTPTGLTSSREQDQGGGSSWTPKQTTTWQYFANGKLNVLNTYNGTTASTNVEAHTVAYTSDPSNPNSA